MDKETEIAIQQMSDQLDTIRDRLEHTYLISPNPEGLDTLYRIDNDTGWVDIFDWQQGDWAPYKKREAE